MAPLTPTWKQPSHPDVLEVVSSSHEFGALSRSKVDLPPGTVLGRITCPPMTSSKKTYTSVQVSATQQIELNCDFVYINHSCEPNLEFHVLNTASRSLQDLVIEVQVARRTDSNGNFVGILAGEELTFFYPSTEWEMVQPFRCQCGTKTCLGFISGANAMETNQLRGRFLNQHIHELLQGQSRDFTRAANGSQYSAIAQV